MRWARYVERMEEIRRTYKFLIGTAESKRPLGKPGRTWDDNIKIRLREMGLGGCGLD